MTLRPMLKLSSIALALPGVEQGMACAGTVLESRTYLVNRKAFLFVSAECARLKLNRSIAEARKCGAQVGVGGWTKVALDELPAAAVLKRWIAESHQLLGGAPPSKKPRARQQATRKRS